MPYGLVGLHFNPTSQRVVWWSGEGRCGTEFPSPVTVSLSMPLFLNSRQDVVGMACGGEIESLASDESYLYFSQGGWLWRLAIGAPPNQAPTQLPIGVSFGFQPAAVARLGDDLFFIESNGTFSKLWKVAGAGTGQQELLFTGNWGVVHKLRVFYGIAPFGVFGCFLGDDGRLWKVGLSPASAPALLASGVKDFDLRSEGGGGGGGLVLLPFYRVFAVQNTQLLAIHYGNGGSSVLYTAETGHTLTTVAVDDQAVYLMDAFWYDCLPLACPAYNVLRQDRPLRDFTPRPWNVIGLVTDGGEPRDLVATGPLLNYGARLVWRDGRTVRSLDANAPPILLNFRAVGLEVVQAIQDFNNSVPLVAGKHTYVRAYAAADFNTTGLNTFFPSGRLTVSSFQAFGQWLPLGTLDPIQAAKVDGATDLKTLRSDLERSYLFELPEVWTQWPLLRCDFTVNGNHQFQENFGIDPYGDNTATAVARFVPVPEQCWVFVAIKTVPQTFYPTDLSSHPHLWRTIERAKSLLPVGKVNVVIWPDLIGPIFSTGDARFALNNKDDWNHALDALAAWTIGRSRPCDCTRYIGTVHPSVGGSIAGMANMDFFSHCSIVRMDANCPPGFNCPTAGPTMAQELGHNFGRKHVNCGNPDGPDPKYPYAPCQISISDLESPTAHFGFDPISQTVINPETTADFMSYMRPSWTSDYTWRGILFSGGCFPPGNVGGRSAQSPQVTAAAEPNAGMVLILAGEVETDTDRVLLFPAFAVAPGILNDQIPTATAAGSGSDPDYGFRLTDAHGATLSEGPLLLGSHSVDETVRGFVQSLPLPDGAQSLQILHHGKVRLERYFSAHAPEVSLFPPRVNAATGVLEADWAGSDADGDPLTYTVQYSNDGGASWIPLQFASPDTALRVDARQLAGGVAARLRVLASDGLRCGLAISEPFAVPDNPPVAIILGRQNGDRVPFGDPGFLTGVAYDPEDGSLSPTAFLWSLTGPVAQRAQGETLRVSNLPPGEYTATLRVTDSAGQTGERSVAFEVEPLIVSDGPAPVVDGAVADDAYESAPRVTLPFGSPPACVRLSHANGFLSVAFVDVPLASDPNDPLAIGVVIDTTGGRAAAPDTSHRGFYVDQNGLPSQWQGDGSALALNLQPTLGVQTAIQRGLSSWSAEIMIPDTLLGGWHHAAGLLFHLRDQNNALTQTWPENASAAYPASWAPALFGVTVTASNRPPEARVLAPRVVTLAPAGTSTGPVTLDGGASFDPDGQSLTYHWTQLAGPPVSLSAPNAAVTTFTPTLAGGSATFRFQLVVNDGVVDSLPATADLVVYAVALNPQPLPPSAQHDPASGVVSVTLNWPGAPGDRAVIEASQDLRVWTPIMSNSVDFDGRLRFRDADAGLFAWRFYRARGLGSSRTVVYQQDFEAGPPGAEWEPFNAVGATPVGNRHFLGPLGAESTTLTLGPAILPAHTRLHLSADLFVIGPWNGNALPPELPSDSWRLRVAGGPELLRATFSNTRFNQSYPGVLGDAFPPRSNAVEVDTLGYAIPGFGGGDAVYHLEFTFDHTDSSLVLEFDGMDLHTFGDRFWGLDNVRLEALNNP
jgi:hypothetical protein